MQLREPPRTFQEQPFYLRDSACITLCLLLLLARLLGCSHSQPDQEPDKTSNQTFGEVLQQNTSSYQIDSSNANFALCLYHLIASQNPEKNIFFSPLSIFVSLAMLSLGAGEDTQTQILKRLGFNLMKLSLPEIHEGFRSLQHTIGSPLTELQVSVGNALILSQDLKLLPEFSSVTQTSFNSEVLHANFNDREAAAQLINNYVKEKTHGKIVNLVSDLSLSVRMVLVNYIFFRGFWKKPFSSSGVSARDFSVVENTVVKVPMMLQGQQEHWFLEDRHVPCTVLQMDYKGDAVAFFILPDQGKMEEVEQMLPPDMLIRWNHLLQNRNFYKKLTLQFQKFSIANSYALDKILPNLGFQNLFTSRANFSNINKEENLQLSKVFHKAVLDVNEVGTEEAAASTGSTATFLSAQPERRHLTFNRPFLLMIYSISSRISSLWGRWSTPQRA